MGTDESSLDAPAHLGEERFAGAPRHRPSLPPRRRSRPRYPRLSRGRERLPEAAMADVEELRQALFAEMRARIKEDDSSVPCPTDRTPMRVRFAEGAEHPLIVRSRRDGGDESRAPRRQCARRGQGLFPSRRQRPQPRPPAPRLCRRRQGLGVFRDPHPRHRDRRGPPRPSSPAPPARRSGRPTAGRSSTSGSTPTTGRRRSSATSSAPTRGRTCSSTRRPTRASSSASARRSRTASSSSTATTTRRRRSRIIDADDAGGRRRVWSRRGGRPSEYSVDDSGEPLLHPDQCRRRRGLQDRHRAGRRARPRALARSRAAPAGPADPVASPPSRTVSSGSSARTACRASSSAISPSGEEHAIAFDEEAYSLGADRRLRVRHRRRSASPIRR